MRSSGSWTPASTRRPLRLRRSINDLPPTNGNKALLPADSNVAIDAMVEDIESARETIHLCAYIWLADTNGCKIKDALIRAAGRGVTVRAMADALGSRRLIRSRHWRELTDRRSPDIGLTAGRRSAHDLESVAAWTCAIIASCWSSTIKIAWCGSQNFADPEFRIKPHYAPWVDVMSRWEGPVAQPLQYLFVSDWIGDGGDDISGLLRRTLPADGGNGSAPLPRSSVPGRQSDSMRCRPALPN